MTSRAWLLLLTILLVGGLIMWPRMQLAMMESDSDVLAHALDGSSLTTPGASGPDIVLIVLDTARRDRVSPYATDLVTPRIARWAEDAIVYDNARATSSWTLPSHASMFTGLYPTEHGAHGAALSTGVDAHGVSPEVPTIAESLRDGGWATVGIAANRGYLVRETGVARGFEAWLCKEIRPYAPDVPYPEAERVTDMALSVLSRPRQRPVFLFVNYMDAHMPYIDRREYFRDKQVFPPPYAPFEESYLATHRTGAPLDPTLEHSWREAYDATLRYLDDEVGRLLAKLPELGVDDDDVVIITSDHGESFGEHGAVEHTKNLYDEEIAIPMLVRAPGIRVGHSSAPVDHTDIARWILDAASRERFDGMVEDDFQLAELHHTRHHDLEDPVLRARFGRVLRSYVKDQRKVVSSSAGPTEFFDLLEDPLESQSTPGADWATDSEQRLEDAFSEMNAVHGSVITRDPDDLEHLKALGYME